MSGYHGTAHYTLALAGGDPNAAGQAVLLLGQAVDGFGPDYARLRALYLPDLAGAHAVPGDIDTVVTIGHQVIDAVTALHSPRAYDRLRVLNPHCNPCTPALVSPSCVSDCSSPPHSYPSITLR